MRTILGASIPHRLGLPDVEFPSEATPYIHRGQVGGEFSTNVQHENGAEPNTAGLKKENSSCLNKAQLTSQSYGGSMKSIKALLIVILLTCVSATAFGANNHESIKSRKVIKERFAVVLNEQLGVDMARLTEHTRFREELSADHTDLTELLWALEEYFDIEVSEEDWAGVTTIKSAVDLIYNIKNSKAW